MSCGEGVERGAATCVCKGQTVFEGAVIGQVFTGEVRLQSEALPEVRPSRCRCIVESLCTPAAIFVLAQLPMWPITLSVSVLLGAVFGFLVGSRFGMYGYNASVLRGMQMHRTDGADDR